MTVSILSFGRGLVGGLAASQPPPSINLHKIPVIQSAAKELNIFTGQY